MENQPGLFDPIFISDKLNERPYQKDCRLAVLEDFKTYRKCLVVSATATGKTVIMSHIIATIKGGGRVLCLAHRQELITQMRDKIESITGVRPAVEMAEERADRWNKSRVVVGSIQTQVAGKEGRKRMHQFNPEDFELIIVDESHRILSPSYRQVVDYYLGGNPKCKLIGFTATPKRASGEAMGKVFEKVSFNYPMISAIDDGWIVKPEIMPVRVDSLDYSSVRTTAGDLNGADMDRVLNFEKVLHGMACPLLGFKPGTFEVEPDNPIGGKQCLVFCSSVRHATRLSEILNRHRPDSARVVSEKTPKEHRKQLFVSYAHKEFQFLCNVGIVTEGTDLPGVEVVALCGATKSSGLFEQMVGRGVRPEHAIAEVLNKLISADERKNCIASSNKKELIVYDFYGNAGKHKLASVMDILGGDYSEEVKERANKIARESTAKSKLPADIMEALKKADDEIKEEIRQAKLKEEEEARARRHIFANVQYTVGRMNVFDLYDLHVPPVRTQYQEPPTQRMVDFLESRGIDASSISRGEAGKMIGQMKSKLTIGQAKYLSKLGYGDEEIKGLSPRDAAVLITKTKQMGGRRQSASSDDITIPDFVDSSWINTRARMTVDSGGIEIPEF